MFLFCIDCLYAMIDKYNKQTGLPDPREEVNPINKERSLGGPEARDQARKDGGGESVHAMS